MLTALHSCHTVLARALARSTPSSRCMGMLRSPVRSLGQRRTPPPSVAEHPGNGTAARLHHRAHIRCNASAAEAAQPGHQPPAQPPSAHQHRRTGASVTKGLVRRDAESSMLRPTDDASLFPFAEPFNVSGHDVSAEEVIESLSRVLESDRVQRVAEVCAQRTFDVVPVIEGIYDLGNVAAVCRSCDALGYGQLHIIDSKTTKYKQSARTSRGAEKWLDVHMWKDTAACIERMRRQGRQVLVTHLDDDAVPITEIDWTRPTAIVFGNEKDGVSAAALAAADRSVVIPMSGFAQSVNISVAAAVVLYEAREARMRAQGRHASLTPAQQRVLTAIMMMRSQKQSETMLATLLSRAAPEWQTGQVVKQARRKERRAQAGNAAAAQNGDPHEPPPHAHYLSGKAYAAATDESALQAGADQGGSGVPGHDRQQGGVSDEGESAHEAQRDSVEDAEPVSLSNMTGKGARVVRTAVI